MPRNVLAERIEAGRSSAGRGILWGGEESAVDDELPRYAAAGVGHFTAGKGPRLAFGHPAGKVKPRGRVADRQRGVAAPTDRDGVRHHLFKMPIKPLGDRILLAVIGVEHDGEGLRGE